MEEVYQEPKSSNILIIILIILIVIFLAGSIFSFYLLNNMKNKGNNLDDVNNSKENRTTTKCSDIDCMISASKNCQPAEFSYTEEKNSSGILIEKTTNYQIQDDDFVECVLNLELENYKLEYSDSLIQDILKDEDTTLQKISDEIQLRNNQLNKLKGKKGDCVFVNNSDLSLFFTKMKNNNFKGDISCTTIENQTNCTTTGDWNLGDCSGEYFNIDLDLGVKKEVV